jgi:tetratricopeptide (TPR) repeat protein
MNKVYHSASKLRVLALMLVVVSATFRVSAMLDRAGLSLLSNAVLHEELRSFRPIEFTQSFFAQNNAQSPYCPAAVARIDSENTLGVADASQQRLTRYISLTCEDDQHIIDRFDRDVAGGYIPTAVDALYIGEALTRNGNADRAMKLRQTMPTISSWYANLGRMAIEQLHNETTALAHFQLANAIDPNFRVEKASMYMYLCLALVRDNKTYILDHPCEDFDRVNRTSTSRLYLGRSSYNRGDFGQALVYLTDAINLGDVPGDAHYWKGKALVALGKISEAEDIFQMGIARVPEYPWNYLDLAELKASEGCYLAARNYLQRMQALNIEDATAAAQHALQALGPYYVDNLNCP